MAKAAVEKRMSFIAKALRLPQVLGLAAVAAGAVALAPVAMASNPACGDAIRITPGDTLLHVATACDTTVPALLAANPEITQPNRLFVGQLVWMPGRNPAAAVHRPAPTPVPNHWGQGAFARCGATVQVRRGDTFSGIARRCGVTPAQLRAENPRLHNPNLIFSGMVLRVPSSTAPTPALPRPAQALRIIGTVTGEGVTCQAFRGDDGRLYTFAGSATRPLRPGDRVEVTGTRAGASICQQGVTINATQVVLLNSVAPASIDLTGTITREGVTCTALRGDDGRLYTVTGQTAGLQPGDRVRITGEVAEMPFCQQGTTINLRSIGAAW
ncbi:LysM peptidoglycan-binding domain-containing protein [Yoonia vestfoldensis]|uniref:LysM peptidoglycan-binding domain-containing protein n=1 Tax=Yoonia vestfoldensis TaxID=245188 RepID=UPI0003793CDD|nr:LysM peptidoglycan-binding domain-containing protein [Yoonia vestfoldensis]